MEIDRLEGFCQEFVYGEDNPKYYETMGDKLRKLEEETSKLKLILKYAHTEGVLGLAHGEGWDEPVDEIYKVMDEVGIVYNE